MGVRVKIAFLFFHFKILLPLMFLHKKGTLNNLHDAQSWSLMDFKLDLHSRLLWQQRGLSIYIF